MPPTATSPDLLIFKMKTKSWIFTWNIWVFKCCRLFNRFVCFQEHLNTGQERINFGDMTCEPRARKVKLVYPQPECWEWYNDFEVGTFWGICSAHNKLPSLRTFIHTGVGPGSHSYHITLIPGLSSDPIGANQSNSLFWKTGIGIVRSQDSWSPELQWWGSGGWGCHGGGALKWREGWKKAAHKCNDRVLE